MTQVKNKRRKPDASTGHRIGGADAIREGDVIQIRDWDGTPCTIKVQALFISQAEGPSVRGIEYTTADCRTHGGICDHNYVSQRSLPLSGLIDPEEEAAKAEALATAKRERNRVSRTRRTGAGVCEHCGEKTSGGRFLAGHDAKLKGDLKRAAHDEAAKPAARQAACAEAQLRAAQHRPDAPTTSAWWTEPVKGDAAKVKALVAQGDGFLRSATAQRIGVDPGRLEEIA